MSNQSNSVFRGRIPNITRRFTIALLSEMLTPKEKTQLTIALYNAHPEHRGGARAPWGDTLAPWEETWFSRRLPKPPAKIIVGACGAGREALALSEAGFQVDAFDPAPILTSLARQVLGVRVFTFSYEDFSAAILEDACESASLLAQERYDAVLLGWGSLSHLLDSTQQERLLRALDRICPYGPILASFWCTNGHAPEMTTLGRAERYGYALGRKVAQLRGGHTETSCRQSFATHRGFGYTFTPEEIEYLSTTIRRELVWEQDNTSYSHVTFLPH